jgi:AbiTii
VSLLREIQNAAVESDSDVASLLRKCKILGARLSNVEFNRWVDNELNGYGDPSQIPDYRKLRVNVAGHFRGAFGSGMDNAPIPPVTLPEELRESLFCSYLTQPISAYVSLIDEETKASAQEQWPQDVLVYYGQKIYQDLNCLSAWKIIPRNALVAIVDTIKTRILNFCLQIEADAPNAGEAPLNSSPIAQEKVTQHFHTNIYGSVQNVATGSTDFTQKANSVSPETSEMFQKLLNEIYKIQGPDLNTTKLAGSVEEMRDSVGQKSFGAKYQNFMSIFSDHLQVYGSVVAPYLPALAALIAK